MSLPQPASSSARFLDESVLPIFTDLRMTAFGQSVIDIAADPAFDDWSFSDKVLYALDKEVAAKRERRVNKLLKSIPIAKSRCLYRRHHLHARPHHQQRANHPTRSLPMVPKRTKHCHPGQILRRQDLPRPSTAHRGVPERLLRVSDLM